MLWSSSEKSGAESATGRMIRGQPSSFATRYPWKFSSGRNPDNEVVAELTFRYILMEHGSFLLVSLLISDRNAFPNHERSLPTPHGAHGCPAMGGYHALSTSFCAQNAPFVYFVEYDTVPFLFFRRRVHSELSVCIHHESETTQFEQSASDSRRKKTTQTEESSESFVDSCSSVLTDLNRIAFNHVTDANQFRFSSFGDCPE